jgi:hypothetical protein
MMSRTELKFEYDDDAKPICATCTACGEKMPKPPAELQNTADIIMWSSEKYIAHRKLKHSQDDRRRFPRD